MRCSYVTKEVSAYYAKRVRPVTPRSSNPPSNVRVASVLDIQPNTPLRSPSHGSRYILGPRGADDVARILSQSASFLSRLGVPANAGAVLEDRRAGVVGPQGIVDADGVASVVGR